MSDHVVLYVDRLLRPESVQVEGDGDGARETSGGGLEEEAGPSCSAGNDVDDEQVGEEEPLLQVGECRICQEEDSINNLETPCACSGSLKVLSSVYHIVLAFYIRFFYFFVDDVLCALPNGLLVFFSLLDGMKLIELGNWSIGAIRPVIYYLF